MRHSQPRLECCPTEGLLLSNHTSGTLLSPNWVSAVVSQWAGPGSALQGRHLSDLPRTACEVTVGNAKAARLRFDARRAQFFYQRGVLFHLTRITKAGGCVRLPSAETGPFQRRTSWWSDGKWPPIHNEDLAGTKSDHEGEYYTGARVMLSSVLRGQGY
jgi:hypothetical protein